MNRVEQAFCRIREKLPNNGGYVTHGVGCVVRHEKLATSLGWKCPNLLVTSVDVLTPHHLASDRIYFAEFLVFEKKGYEVFELKPAAEFCKALSGRTFGEDDKQPNEQLTVISVEPLDKRGFLKRMVKKSSLQNTRPLDCFNFENLESEINSEGIFCNVIREFGSLAQEFESRTYKFKYSTERRLYLLEDFGHRDVELEVKSFPVDQTLAGGVIFSKQGLYLGCLGYSTGQILPAFVPDTYPEKQGVETLEEAPEREEQAENEALASVLDSEKPLSTDENENKESAERNFEVDNDMEKQKEPETEMSYNQQEEISDISQREQLEGNKMQQQNADENLKQEDENVEQSSENKRGENIENNPRISEMKEERKDSADLEFVISVDHEQKESSEGVDTEEVANVDQEERETSEKVDTEETANENQIEDNDNNEDNRIQETTDTPEEIASETEVIKEGTQLENVENSQGETEVETHNKINEEIEEHKSESITDKVESVTDVTQEDIIEDHKNIDTTNSDRSHLIGDSVLEEPGVIVMETQLHSDIQESSERGIEMEETSVPAEVIKEEEKLVQSELPSAKVASDDTLEAGIESAQESKDYEGLPSIDQAEVPNKEEREKEAQIQADEVLPSLDQTEVPNEEETKNEAQIQADEELHSVVQNEVVNEEEEEIEAQVQAGKDLYPVGHAEIVSEEREEKETKIQADEDAHSVGQANAVSEEERGAEAQIEVSENKQTETTVEIEKAQNEEIHEEGSKGTPDVLNQVTSEQESNTTASLEKPVSEEEPKDSSDQSENDLLKHVGNAPENLSIKPDSPDGVEMEVKKDVVELEKPVKQEPGEPLEPDDLLSTKVTENPKALEDLSLLLDTEYQHGGVSSWHDLAELLAIPKEAYDHCLSFSKPSPTEDLMVFLANTKPQFTISDLKDSLRSTGRGDAVHLLDRYIARSIISDETVIQGVIERDDIDLLGELALKLDRGQQNWKGLARQLEVPSRILRNFGSHQRQNSALLMLKYLPIFDPDLTVESLKESCQAVGLLDVVKFLDASGVPGEDAIMDILEDTDVIDELTDMLNEEDVEGPNWKKLGRKLNIPEEKFCIFEPSKQNSPTKLLLQSIAQCEPDITVDELILALVAMKRHDVIEMLGKHFRYSDIRSILEENNCLPPQPETARQDQNESIA